MYDDESQRLAFATQIVVTFNDPNFVNPLNLDDTFNERLDKIAEDNEEATQAIGKAREAFALFREEPYADRQTVLVKALAQIPLKDLQVFVDDMAPTVEEHGPMQFSAVNEIEIPSEAKLTAEEESEMEFSSLLRYLSEVLSIDLNGISTRKTFIRDLRIALMNKKPIARPRPNADDLDDEEEENPAQFSASGQRRKPIAGSCTCNADGRMTCRMHNQPRPVLLN